MTTLNQLSSEITNLTENYNLTSFVETGCYKGDSLMYIKNKNFRNLYSCDINQECVDNCKKLLPESNIVHSDSISFFNEILPTLTEKTLFWLDAHFPAYYGLPETPETKFPLIEELILIKKLKPNYQNDVILCDDIRILLAENNPHYDHGIWQQFNVNHTLKELTSVLDDTHTFKTVSAGEGVLIFTPK